MKKKTRKRKVRSMPEQSLNNAKLRAIELIHEYPDFYSRERIISNFMYLDMKDKNLEISKKFKKYIKNDGLKEWKKSMEKSGLKDVEPNLASKMILSGYKYAKHYLKDTLIKEITEMPVNISFSEIIHTLVDDDSIEYEIPQEKEEMHMVEFDLFGDSDEIKIEKIN